MLGDGGEVDESVEHASFHPAELLDDGQGVHAAVELLQGLRRSRLEQVRFQRVREVRAGDEYFQVAALREAKGDPFAYHVRGVWR